MNVQPAPGRLIANKYRLLERVGIGGMSEVYRAEVLGSDRVVAVKVLLPHKLEDPSFVARLFQEAQSGLRIRHPGIVPVHEAGQSDLGPFLVMDYLTGESAGRLLFERGRFSVPAALCTMMPVLDALQAAHDADVVHRDLKPGNIFYSVDGRNVVDVKLLDFGVAKALWPGGGTPRTSTGVVMGTPDYLSPEQANGEPDVDGRSDVFAAGVVLFELLTATRPFHAPTAVATAYKVSHARTPLLRERGGPSDTTLQAIIERALAKRADERYPSAREMLRELESVAPPAAEAASVLSELVRPERHLGKTKSGSGERPATPAAGLDQRSGASRVAGWTPVSNPLAPSAAPQKQARGIVLRALDQYVRQVFGDAPRARVLESMPKEAADELVYDSLQAIVLYDVETLNRYCELATREAAMGNVGWARTAGARAVTAELGAILRHVLKPSEAPVLLRRVCPVLSRLFSFGAWEIDENGQLTTLRITDVSPLGPGARLWLVGVVEGSFATAGVRARSTIARGEAGFSRELVLDIVAT